MSAPEVPPSDEFPPIEIAVDQVEGYRFQVSYPGTRLEPSTVDVDPPVGTGTGPNPEQALAAAVGHCLSATLFSTLERSHVRTTPIRTYLTLRLGRNEKGRKRVTGLDVRIECAPLDETERERFERCLSVFEDFCTVTASVRQGIPVRTAAGPGDEIVPAKAAL
jgi:organic hydroperoxide reductase OsmC/OhrA